MLVLKSELLALIREALLREFRVKKAPTDIKNDYIARISREFSNDFEVPIAKIQKSADVGVIATIYFDEKKRHSVRFERQKSGEVHCVEVSEKKEIDRMACSGDSVMDIGHIKKIQDKYIKG